MMRIPWRQTEPRPRPEPEPPKTDPLVASARHERARAQALLDSLLPALDPNEPFGPVLRALDDTKERPR